MFALIFYHLVPKAAHILLFKSAKVMGLDHLRQNYSQMQSKKKSGCLLLGFRFPSRGEVLLQLNLGELQEPMRLTTDCASWRASETMP